MQKQTNNILTPASFLKTSLSMFLAFLGGQIALMIVSVMLVDDAYVNVEDTGNFIFMRFLLLLYCVFLAEIIFISKN